MKNNFFKTVLGISVVVLITLAFSTSSFAMKKRIIFGGGPAGGTFQVVANGIQVYKPIKQLKNVTVKAQTSAGSVENLRKTDAGRHTTRNPATPTNPFSIIRGMSLCD